MNERETIARIVDPRAFIIENTKRFDMLARQREALAKADAILSALPAHGPAQLPVGESVRPAIQPVSGKDFYDLSGPDLLQFCGADARKWAQAFCRIKEAQGWSTADIDEGLMIGWFANAIEHAAQVRTPQNSGVQNAGGSLTEIAAECHRSKWQFEENEEHLMPAAEARRLVRKAFNELYRIGDMAMKARDEVKAASVVASAQRNSEGGT